MPKPREQKGDPNVAVHGAFTRSSAPKRDVHIIPKPSGQTDVPTVPKSLYAVGVVRMVEILAEAIAHQTGQTSRNGTVPRKIEVNLQGKSHQDHPPVPRGRVIVVIAKSHIHNRGQIVGKDHFLKKTISHEAQAIPNPHPRHRTVFRELVEQVFGPHNGPCHQLGEQRAVSEKMPNVAGRAQFSSVDINGITHGLEGVKTNANR